MADEPTQPALSFIRAPDFLATYANNVGLESSFWDLKMIFGELDQSGPISVTQQKASVTIPWAQVKLMVYYLQVNLLFHELNNGPVKLRKDILPPDPSQYVDRPNLDETAKDVIRRMKKVYDDFVASLDV